MECSLNSGKIKSIGQALIDTIDDLINDGRIEPQLAMKILTAFDKAVAEVLADKVKSRLTFKVRRQIQVARCILAGKFVFFLPKYRVTSKPTGSATTCGLSWSRM